MIKLKIFFIAALLSACNIIHVAEEPATTNSLTRLERQEMEFARIIRSRIEDFETSQANRRQRNISESILIAEQNSFVRSLSLYQAILESIRLNIRSIRQSRQTAENNRGVQEIPAMHEEPPRMIMFETLTNPRQASPAPQVPIRQELTNSCLVQEAIPTPRVK